MLGEDSNTRRWQTGLVLLSICLVVLGLHLSPVGSWMVLVLAWGVAVYALRLLTSNPVSLPIDRTYLPRISILVAAKDEEQVIKRLVGNLCTLQYAGELEVWIGNDGSTDCTGELLERLCLEQPRLHVLHRLPGDRPGKSAVLNDLFSQSRGDILIVFDADAQVDADFLTRTVPLFAQPGVGAVQVRKAIANADENFWTRNQAAEMLFDAFFQLRRQTIGGTAELRGNGQLVRATALQQVGDWTESTVTDDLDLTLKLHLQGWQVQFVWETVVWEEGVTSWQALWRQRSRWAEGGFQRYLDHARSLLKKDLGDTKSLDQAVFCTIQYLMPVAALIDLSLAVFWRAAPLLTPLLLVATTMTAVGFYRAQRQTGVSVPEAVMISALGTLYFLHWFPVIVIKLVSMAIYPKRLVWVKTVHQG
ncbi:MAG: glycosyltransferase family 2 protein [Gemmatimonadaceae bacterium]|nr:glycosyltransferase family 2 protein [Gloeobacterales cyanobacterium ES-bin-141]